jgi:hypothetical protein
MASIPGGALQDRAQLEQALGDALDATPVLDMHTHLYSADFGGLLLWGVDELVTYHYLIAEVCRAPGGPTPAEFYALGKQAQADRIWRHLFQDATPLSEACRGILTTLQALGIDVNGPDLSGAREYFADVTMDQHIDRVFELSNVGAAVMTNDPFDPPERPVWLASGCTDSRFIPALRLDGVLVFWEMNAPVLQSWGYAVTPELTANTCREVRRFLEDEIRRMRPVYMAVSLPDTFAYPAQDATATLIRECVVPVARETGVPFAMMIGVKRQLNPALGLAGDGVGKADIRAVERICGENPDVRFLVTMLSRENQHELCVAARKLPNLMPFGCWWFLNDPSLIDEITRMRLELLGLSVIPQHSDARVLDQLVYKWRHSRAVLKQVLADKYLDVMATGWAVTEADVRRDVARLLEGGFRAFVGMDRGTVDCA